MNIEKGYLFITDITGCTQFLTQSELDHATEIFYALFDSILHHLHPPMVISGTQGDAIICYFPEHAFNQPQSIVEGMEHIYYDFQRQLSLMKLNSTCTCKACDNMSSLDLKVFLHYGQYMLQQIGDRWDLQSADIIPILRLMKNSVKEKFGLTGYGLITKAAIGAMGITGPTDGMHEHVEQVEHFGDVRMFIHDLKAAWETHRKTDRQIVAPENAFAWAEAFVPIPQWLAWDLSFNNEVKGRLFFVDSHERVEETNTRIEPGTGFHCVHGEDAVDYVIIDMDAPNHVTSRNKYLGMSYLFTLKFKPTTGGTMFSVLYGAPDVEFSEENRELFQQAAENTSKMLAQIAEEEITAGRIPTEQIKEIENKKREHLRPGVEQGRFAKLAGKNS